MGGAPSRCLGVDVGARRLHVAELTGSALVVVRTVSVEEMDSLVEWAAGAAAIAIDSPDRWSSTPHAGDDSLAPKFRAARCAEIGLGRQFGVWVSWATPPLPVAGSWMAAGIELFAALRSAGHAPLEVYPFAAFRSLAGGRALPKKQTRAGRRERASLLSVPDELSHDFLDATVAALVACDHLHGRALPATCGHDGTAIWLPARRPLPAGVAEAAATLGRR